MVRSEYCFICPHSKCAADSLGLEGRFLPQKQVNDVWSHHIYRLNPSEEVRNGNRWDIAGGDWVGLGEGKSMTT